MITAHRLPKPLLLLFAAMLALVLTVSMTGAKGGNGHGGKGGNSAVAQLCDDDGWMGLASAEDPMTAFESQDACTAYGAEGGEVVDLQLPPEFEMCADYPGLKVDPVAEQGYFDGTFTVTNIYDNGAGPRLDWTSTVPVLRVTVKGGPLALSPNTYLYPGGKTADTGLHAPFNINTGTFFGIQYLCVVFDEKP
ncbi:hypothetical protein [Agromyces sp. SYSU T0242]|uniref:hypothetical protein n=1 Tax=Agromyces litoreus TaxID=3158561 RepID=UPI003394D536